MMHQQQMMSVIRLFLGSSTKSASLGAGKDLVLTASIAIPVGNGRAQGVCRVRNKVDASGVQAMPCVHRLVS